MSEENETPVKKVVVYVPGMRGLPWVSTIEAWAPLVQMFESDADFSDAHWIPWDHKASVFSSASLFALGTQLADYLEALWLTENGWDELILVGHSMGGLLVRVAWMLANEDIPEAQKYNWGQSTARLVLLAALNRGLSHDKAGISIGDRVIPLLTFGRSQLWNDLLAGSLALTDLRIRWLRLLQSSTLRHPLIVQLLGQKDSLVSKDDSVDLVQLPDAWHVPVPDADHRQIHRVARASDPQLRYELLKKSIMGERPVTASSIEETTSARHVVFVLHGIRDSNRDWVSTAEDRIKGEFGESVHVATPGYPWLSALEFALPFLHRRPIHRFQSLYCDYLARFPGASFHFLGHSNGSYILGRSLRELPGLRFENVALAGSVLPADYPWLEKVGSGQIARLRNDCANADLPVGLLCSGLRGVGRNDIGTGGFDGFLEDEEGITQIRYHKGGHGAALDEDNLQSIAEFLLTGEVDRQEETETTEQRFGFLSRIAPQIFRLLVFVLIGTLFYAIFAQSLLLLGSLVGGFLATIVLLKYL